MLLALLVLALASAGCLAEPVAPANSPEDEPEGGPAGRNVTQELRFSAGAAVAVPCVPPGGDCSLGAHYYSEFFDVPQEVVEGRVILEWAARTPAAEKLRAWVADESGRIAVTAEGPTPLALELPEDLSSGDYHVSVQPVLGGVTTMEQVTATVTLVFR